MLGRYYLKLSFQWKDNSVSITHKFLDNNAVLIILLYLLLCPVVLLGLVNVPSVAVRTPPQPLGLATYVISKPVKDELPSVTIWRVTELPVDIIGGGMSDPQTFPTELASDMEPSKTCSGKKDRFSYASNYIIDYIAVNIIIYNTIFKSVNSDKDFDAEVE